MEISVIDGLPERNLSQNFQVCNFMCNNSQFDIVQDVVIAPSDKEQVSTIDVHSSADSSRRYFTPSSNSELHQNYAGKNESTGSQSH